MGSENRVITISSSVDDRTLDYAELNELQDRMICFRPMSEEEGSLPSGWGGGIWLYGQLTLAPVTSVTYDIRTDYWGGDPLKESGDVFTANHRNALVFVAYSSDPDYQPNGVDHSPAGQTDIQYLHWNLAEGATAWTPFAGEPDITINLSNSGTIAVANADAVNTRYVYLWVFLSQRIDYGETGTYRQKSFADYGRMTSEYLKKVQDYACMLDEANLEEGGLPATFLGGCWYFGEFTIANGADTKMDETINWQDRMLLGFYSDVAAATGLPSGANHAPTAVTNSEWALFGTKSGVAVGGPFGSVEWTPIANVDVYADAAGGSLYCSNNTGAPVYVYFLILATDPIA